MNFIKKNFYKLSMVLMLVLTFFVRVKADSGFDGSYDGGSGGFDGFHGSYSGSSGLELDARFYQYLGFALIYLFICFILHTIFLPDKNDSKTKKLNNLYIFLTALFENIIVFLNYDIDIIIINFFLSITVAGALSRNHKSTKKTSTKSLTMEKIYAKLGHDFDLEGFYKEVFNNYKDIQIAWMNNKLEDVRKLLTDEMFNMYQMQLMTLTTKKQKNMMEDITYIDAHIMDIRKLGDKDEIDVCLNVSCRDYIINTVDNEVLRGNEDAVVEYVYKLSFVRTNNINKPNVCPSCNAKLEDQISSKCPYCNNIVIKESSKFILAEKKVLSQSRR